jgi:hypothetical protein
MVTIKSLNKGQRFVNTLGAIVTILYVEGMFVTYRFVADGRAYCTEIKSCLKMLNQNYYFEEK